VWGDAIDGRGGKGDAEALGWLLCCAVSRVMSVSEEGDPTVRLFIMPTARRRTVRTGGLARKFDGNKREIVVQGPRHFRPLLAKWGEALNSRRQSERSGGGGRIRSQPLAHDDLVEPMRLTAPNTPYMSPTLECRGMQKMCRRKNTDESLHANSKIKE
jgi:hypothetical protein